MIVKGRARSGPEQLAAYLMRDDGTERATILDHGDDLHNDFLLWHTIGYTGKTEATLYHAQICPDAKYGREMTPEKWLEAAQMLAEDMGMAHHPRRVVLHDGGENPHVHVVFQRCDPETLKMWEVWKNYKKHEKASLRMSKEFGMEIVPGKHAKRDRKKQPEFPRQKMTEAEAQQQKRTGLKLADRKAEIAELYGAASTGQSFKNALEASGYVLAQGERGYLIVDTAGGHSVIQRNIKGLKKEEVDRFMADVPMNKLPTLDQAKALQKERAETPVLKPVERSRFLQPEAPAKVEEPTPAPPVSKFLSQPEAPAPAAPPPAPEAKPFDYELYANYNRPPAPPAPVFEAPVVQPPAPVVTPPEQPASKFLPAKEPAPPPPAAEKQAGVDLTLYAPKAPAPTPPSPPAPVPPAREPTTAPDSGAPAYDWTRYALKPEFPELQPPPPPKPRRPREARDVFDLRRSIFKAQKEEYNGFIEKNAAAYKQQDAAIDNANVWKMEDFDHKQRAALQDFRERLSPEPRKGAAGMLDKLNRALNPQDDALTAAKQEDLALFKSQQAHDRRDYIKSLEQGKVSDLEKFRDRQLAEQAARERGYNAEIERRIAEFKQAKRLKADTGASTTKRREPLPSDPWMAQRDGIEKLSPEHLASAQRSYDAWSRNQEYDFQNYVEYVQRQWEKVPLPPVPQPGAPQPPKPAYDPATYAPKAPKTDPWTDAEIKSKFNALQNDPEIERRIREFKEARRIAAELEADARKREKDRDREGPEPPEEGKE